MRIDEFDYALPDELIAQYPNPRRSECRLMVLDRKRQTIEHLRFKDIVGYVGSGDCVVVNNTKVIPARLFGKRSTGGKVELFILEWQDRVAEALVRPAGRLKEGEKVTLESGDVAVILGRTEIGRTVQCSRPVKEIMDEAGHVPLPPYIDRMDEDSDRTGYQTVFARVSGATASPTAGLHFTEELADEIRGKGAIVCPVTLHTSYGTFAPIKVETVESHRMHREYFVLPEETAAAVRRAKGSHGSVVAVGTTAARTLETCAQDVNGQYVIEPMSGSTDLFIYPGYRFKAVDRIVTNFHLPKSTLLLLVSAFAGREFILDAYREAIRMRYQFFSYGDAMLIL